MDHAEPDKPHQKLFEKEIYVWSKLKHENVLPLLGFAFDEGTGYPLLISDWMDSGSAWSFVRSNPNCNVLHLVRIFMPYHR